MATAATAFAPNGLSLLVNNISGNVESLPRVTYVGARQRTVLDQITCAAQASGTVIGIARIPIGAVLLAIEIKVSATLGTATLAFGDVNTTNLYAAAATYTTTNTPTRVGNATAMCVPVTSGWDSYTGLASTSYEDVTMTVGTAALPASGTITFQVEYAID